MTDASTTTFSDQKQAQWTIRIDGRIMAAVNAELGINLCDAMVDYESFIKKLNPSQAIDITWVALRDVAASRDIRTKDDFLTLLDGPAIQGLVSAFWVALANFSQPAAITPAVSGVMQKANNLLRVREAKARELLESLTEEELEKAMKLPPLDKLRERLLGDTTESSSSTPAS